MQDVPLIPRRVLFGNPDRAMPRLSPDGRRLAFLAEVDGVLEVWVGPAEDVAAARPVTQDRKRGIRVYEWAYDGRHVLYLQDEGGDEDWHLHATDLAEGTTRDLTPVRGIQARVAAVSPRRPHEVVVALNDRDARWHDLHLVDLRTGERTLLLRNDRFVSFVLDRDFRVRFAEEIRPDGGKTFRRLQGDGAWEPFGDVPPEDVITTGLVGLDDAATRIYLEDSRGRDTAALLEVDLADGTTIVLAEDPRADVADVLVHPRTLRPEAVSFDPLRREWRTLDARVERHLRVLHAVCDGEMSVTGRTLDDRWWTVAFVVDDGPVRFYRYDTEERRAHFLFTSRPAIEGLPLAKMRAVRVPARDALELPCYVTVPPAGKGPFPTVLFVHGGPWARDVWGFHPVHQWLANRGYAVLSVNFRGSTGFGKRFVNAADHEWGRKMHEDLLDAVEWAVREGIADRAKVAISGGSYGGYATLVGLTMTPDVFACGVDVVGPSSIVTLIRSIPPYWVPLRTTFTKRVGDPDTPEGLALLEQRSPITHVDRIRRPLLIAQGANDPRVKQAESDRIVEAMRGHGIPVTYVLFPDEGHGFARPENQRAFRAVEEEFLARHLGGRVEPPGDDFAGSSILVDGAAPPKS